jgi:hypothetical protein
MKLLNVLVRRRTQKLTFHHGQTGENGFFSKYDYDWQIVVGIDLDSESTFAYLMPSLRKGMS